MIERAAWRELASRSSCARLQSVDIDLHALRRSPARDIDRVNRNAPCHPRLLKT
jgi:hypothetical protein